MKRLVCMMMTLALLCGVTACGGTAADSTSTPTPEVTTAPVTETYADAVHVVLSDGDITVNGGIATDDTTQAVYVAKDIVYYEEGKGISYGEGTAADAHSADEAAAHRVVHITAPGTYLLTGELSAGQIAVDLGKQAKSDPSAVVTLVLGGVDITCTVAPAVIFYNVYECGSTDEASASYRVDTAAAGANVIIADGTDNQVRGAYVARIYKADTVVLNAAGTEVVEAKKLHKYDAAFYSKMSMNVDGGALGNGKLRIAAENEGLDTELHLTINGGNVRIESGNDGINTNEDGISVTTINGGSLDIVCNGATGEGDGIDSNGWLVINGGTVTAQGCATSMDGGIDSDMGIYINGGTVIATGNMPDAIAGGNANYAVFQFGRTVTANTQLTLRDASDAAVCSFKASNAFSYLVMGGDFLQLGDYTLWAGDTQLAHGGTGSMGFGGMGRPNGMDFGNMNFEGMDFGDMDFSGMERPNGFGGDRGGMTMPEGFDPNQFGGQMPPNGMERPGGMERPNGTERPEGMGRPEGMNLPNGGGMPWGGGETDGEQSAVFTITAGGNNFYGVTALTA